MCIITSNAARCMWCSVIRKKTNMPKSWHRASIMIIFLGLFWYNISEIPTCNTFTLRHGNLYDYTITWECAIKNLYVYSSLSYYMPSTVFSKPFSKPYYVFIFFVPVGNSESMGYQFQTWNNIYKIWETFKQLFNDLYSCPFLVKCQ